MKARRASAPPIPPRGVRECPKKSPRLLTPIPYPIIGSPGSSSMRVGVPVQETPDNVHDPAQREPGQRQPATPEPAAARALELVPGSAMARTLIDSIGAAERREPAP